jgi:hypothetical protein
MSKKAWTSYCNGPTVQLSIGSGSIRKVGSRRAELYWQQEQGPRHPSRGGEGCDEQSCGKAEQAGRPSHRGGAAVGIVAPQSEPAGTAHTATGIEG